MTFDVTSVGAVPIELGTLSDRTDVLVISEVNTWIRPPAACPVFPPSTLYEGGVLETGRETTTARLTYQRVLLRMEGGRAILQDANTSAVDIEMLPPTPGTLPN